METKYFGEFRDVYSKAAGDVYSKAVSEMYSKAVSEMYSQFKETHPLEKYIGRLAYFCGEKLEIVGYRNDTSGARLLIADGTKIKAWGWKLLDTWDVVFKNCESYCYVIVDDLIYKKL